MPSPEPSQTPAALSFDVRYLAPGKSSVMLFLPEAYHAAIGLVVAYWGNFEVVFDACLSGLIADELADGRVRDNTNWKYRSFKKRRLLFINICREWVATWKPEVADQLVAVVDASAPLQAKRNLIAHGTYSYTIPPNSSVATDCYAVKQATGEKMPFDQDVLKALYHEISHLTADLVNAFRAIAKIEGPFHAIPDDELLRVYHDTIHPWNPDPSKRPTDA